LDGYWSDHLASALDEEIRLGRHHLLLDLSDVVFLSSAGIGVLMKSYNELESIRGSLSIWKASERVRKVIEICGLDQMLLAKEDVLQADKRVLYATSSLIRHVERPEASFDVYQLAPEAGLTCRVVGDAKLIEGCGFSKENCYSMDFPDSSFAIGLGALGENFDECRSRLRGVHSCSGRSSVPAHRWNKRAGPSGRCGKIVITRSGLLRYRLRRIGRRAI
jgi:anti-sigma B factor antagonist